MLLTVIYTFLCFIAASQQPIIIPLDNFDQYKDTSDFFDTWTSRSDGYKKTLKENSYYYYIKEDAKDPKNKQLCSSLRQFPKDFIRQDLDAQNIKMVTDNTTQIPSVTIYKSYWGNSIKLGKKYHKEGKEAFLEWDWVVYKLPEGSDEYVLDLNDSAIAVYPIFNAGAWRFRSIKFIWSATNHPQGIVPWTLKEKDVRYYILENKNSELGVWKHESVNISKIIKEFLPERYDSIAFVAISVLANTANVKKSSAACVDNLELILK